jgi:hypothetical protein
MNFSHQPSEGFASVEAACEEADNPVCNRITLSFLAERVPHVSYAISKDRSDSEYTSSSGSEWW